MTNIRYSKTKVQLYRKQNNSSIQQFSYILSNCMQCYMRLVIFDIHYLMSENPNSRIKNEFNCHTTKQYCYNIVLLVP